MSRRVSLSLPLHLQQSLYKQQAALKRQPLCTKAMLGLLRSVRHSVRRVLAKHKNARSHEIKAQRAAELGFVHPVDLASAPHVSHAAEVAVGTSKVFVSKQKYANIGMLVDGFCARSIATF